MRLTRDQIAAIRQAAEESFGEGSQVWLFGSRVDDRRRGAISTCWFGPRKLPVPRISSARSAFWAGWKGRLGNAGSMCS